MEDHGIAGAWKLAPALAAAGLGVDWLDGAAERTPAGSLGDMLAWLAAMLGGTALAHEIEQGAGWISALVRDYAPGLPRITAYGRKLNQVWTHLLSNAITAVGPGGEIVVRTGSAANGVRVEIADDGPGIPE